MYRNGRLESAVVNATLYIFILNLSFQHFLWSFSAWATPASSLHPTPTPHTRIPHTTAHHHQFFSFHTFTFTYLMPPKGLMHLRLKHKSLLTVPLQMWSHAPITCLSPLAQLQFHVHSPFHDLSSISHSSSHLIAFTSSILYSLWRTAFITGPTSRVFSVTYLFSSFLQSHTHNSVHLSLPQRIRVTLHNCTLLLWDA